MPSTGKFNVKLNKYQKLNILVLVIILAMLVAVFFWYQRSVDRIEREMTKKMIVEKKGGGRPQAAVPPLKNKDEG